MQGFDNSSCVFVESLKFRGILHTLHEHILVKKKNNDLKLGNVKVLFGGRPHAVIQTCDGIYMPDMALCIVSMPSSDIDFSALRCIDMADFFV